MTCTGCGTLLNVYDDDRFDWYYDLADGRRFCLSCCGEALRKWHEPARFGLQELVTFAKEHGLKRVRSGDLEVES